MLCASNQVILQIRGQIHKIGAVARDADNQVAIFFRILLGREQCFPC